MDCFKKWMVRVFCPKLWFTVLCVPIAAAALIYVFSEEGRPDVVAYASYAFSAYVLTLVCVRVVQSAGHAKENIDAVMDRVPVVRRYFQDVSFNMHVTLYRSLALNVLYAILKLCFSVYYHSVWFGTLAIYYILLALMRFSLLRYSMTTTYGADQVTEWKYYRRCGAILLPMNVALIGVVILAVRKNESFHYPGFLIYVVALYAFYSITMAIRNVRKYRRYRSPVMSAARAVHLASALVSMLALETAMLYQFNDGREHFRVVMTGCTGGAVCAIILFVAVFMIVRSNRKLKMLKQEEPT